MRSCFPKIAHRLLSADEERALASRIGGNDADDAKEAINELVAHNLRFAADMAAKRKRSPGVDLEDMFAEAVLGLYEAARRFDPERSRFTTYAAWYVLKRLQTLDASRYVMPVTPQIYHRVSWSDERLAESGEIGRRRYARARAAMFGRVLLESVDMPEDESRIDGKDYWTLVEQIPPLIDRLPQREADVVRSRFGPARQTLKQIGERLGLTRERIRQIQEEAIRHLREMAAKMSPGIGS